MFRVCNGVGKARGRDTGRCVDRAFHSIDKVGRLRTFAMAEVDIEISELDIASIE